MDFESALIKAINEAFPGIRLNGCFFHLAQSVHRQLTHGLKQRYSADANINLQVRMLLSLAFVRQDVLRKHFDALRLVVDEDLLPVLDYFERTYIGRLQHELSNQQFFRQSQSGA